MFVTANQIYIFFACISFGGVVGVFFSVSIAIKWILKNKWLKILPDVVVFCIVSVLYVLYSYNMQFSSLRLYMLIGVVLGIVLYLKSFHIILAKILKKVYNIIKDKFNEKVARYNERRKVKKANSCHNCRRSVANSNTNVSNAFRNHKDKQRKKSYCRVGKGNRTLRAND